MTRLTTPFVQNLKRRLLGERERLLGEARQELVRWGEHPIGELTGEVPDVGDESVATMVTYLDHAIVERHIEEIRDIDAALQRITKRQYGRCIDCDEDIEPARLTAFPTAKRCVDCQSLQERTFAQRGRPTL
jgi:RNA polymerase-binding transcription factor DksA